MRAPFVIILLLSLSPSTWNWDAWDFRTLAHAFCWESVEKVRGGQCTQGPFAVSKSPVSCFLLPYIQFHSLLPSPASHLTVCVVVWCNEWPARLLTQVRSSDKERVLLRAHPLPLSHPLPSSSPPQLLIFPPAAASILLQSQPFCRTQPGTYSSCLFYQQPVNKTRGLPSGYLECHPAGSSKKCNMGDQNILGETQKNDALTEDNRQWVGFELPEPGN